MSPNNDGSRATAETTAFKMFAERIDLVITRIDIRFDYRMSDDGGGGGGGGIFILQTIITPNRRYGFFERIILSSFLISIVLSDFVCEHL